MLKRQNKRSSGVSPIIAAVILIAVTVAVAGVAGGYIFGLFGAQTTTPHVSVVTATLSGTTLSITFKNTGAGVDSIDSITVPGNTIATPPADLNVAANVASVTKSWTLGTGVSAGQTISLSLRLKSGSTIPVVVTAG